MYKAACKHGMGDMIWDTVNSENLEGTVNEKKALTKLAVREFEIRNWKASCMMYEKLDLYAENMKTIKMHPWWAFVRENPSMMHKASSVVAALLGTQPVNMQHNFVLRTCQLCEVNEKETPVHILFNCIKITSERERLWGNLIRVMPPALSRELDTIDMIVKGRIIMAGLNGSYIHEWAQIYREIANFVYGIYKERDRLYRDMKLVP